MIYLDSAATTFQKPAAVRAAMLRAMQTMSSPGRGGYPSARAGEETLFRCRSLAAELFGAADPEQVVFTGSATHGLNIAIKSLVPRGGRAVISGYEHNAVTRVLHALGAEIAVASSPLFDDDACVKAFAGALRRETDAVICTMASNVYGCILPVERVAALCRRMRVPLIVDASQSAGVLPLNVRDLGAAFVAMPGHKGLYGPQGTGLLLCGPGVLPETLMEGGTGSASLEQGMPDFLPDRLEPGTHNMPGIAGLEAGMRFVRAKTTQRILNHERMLLRQTAEGLRNLDRVEFYQSPDPERQLGVLSFTVRDAEPENVAEALARRGFAVRAGYQCAPAAHRSGGTLDSGTVRVSFSAFNNANEIRLFVRALGEILRQP